MSPEASPEETDAIPPSTSRDGGALGDDVLPFEVWSETSARLTRMDARETDRILAAIEVDRSRWEASDMHWTLALAAEIADERMDRATSHGARCVEEMSRRRARSDGAGPAGSPAAPPAVVRIAGVPGPAGLVDATAEMTALRNEPALPFDAPRAGGVFGAWRGAAPAALLRATEKAPRVWGPLEGETMEVPALANSTERALPFLDPVHAAERWTAEHYASLCAELSVFQAHSRDVLARYHLEDDAARRRLDEEWRRRVAGDPRLGHEIQSLYAAYRAYLVKA